MSDWIKEVKTRSFRGPFPHSLSLVGRHFDQARYDMAIKTKERQEREACELEQERKMLKNFEIHVHRERFIKKSDEKMKFVKIRNKMKDELQLHQLALENRQDKLRELLSTEKEQYQREAVAKESTALDRLAESRQTLKEIKERKEMERQELVKLKYLQQAWTQSDELRLLNSRRLELVTDVDRANQIAENRKQRLQQMAMGAVFHQQVLHQVEKSMKREEHEAVQQHRMIQEQAEMLLYQIASGDTKEAKQKRVAEEQKILFEQMALRKKEADEERDGDIDRKRRLHAMYDEDMRLGKEKRDKLKLEENIFDLNWLEEESKKKSHEEMERIMRKKELNAETAKYLADLRCTRLAEKKRAAQIDQAIQEDVEREMEKQLSVERARAAASQRLLCDVTEAQKFQRQEKSANTNLTLEQREQQRCLVIEEAERVARLELEARQRDREKRRHYGCDLIGQMNYNMELRDAEKCEEERLLEQQKVAEREFNERVHYLMENPMGSKQHWVRQKYNEMMSSLPASPRSKCGR